MTPTPTPAPTPRFTDTDPQIGPQMIDPEPQMIPDEDRKWSRQKKRNAMKFGFLDFVLLFILVIYIFFLNLTII